MTVRSVSLIRRWLLLAPMAGLLLGLCLPAPVLAVDEQYQTFMRNARRYVAKGQHDLAANIYRRVLQQHPRDVAASVGLAEVLIATDQLDDAETFLVEAVERVPDKADLYRVRVGLRRAQQRPAEAFEDALLVLEGKPDLASWVFRETQELIQVDDMDAETIRKRAEKARKAHPEDVNFAILEATTEVFRGEEEDALRVMIKADKRLTLGGSGLLRYAEEMNGMGRESAALEGMLAAVESAEKPSQRSRILFQVADIQEKQRKFEDALASLTMITDERKGTSAAGRALIRRAEIHQKYLDDPEGALEVYLQVKDDPVVGHHRPEMLLKMADCYVRLGNFAGASETYQEVLPEALDPEQAEKAQLKLAEVEFFRGNPDSALVLYQDMAEANARSLFADDAAGRYIILNRYQAMGGGEILKVFGRMEWARMVGDSSTVAAAAAEIRDAYPRNELAAEALLALADMARAAGDYQGALGYLETVTAEHATDRRAPKSLMRQADILQNHLGRRQEALMRYERILTDYSDSVPAGEARRLVESLRRELKS